MARLEQALQLRQLAQRLASSSTESSHQPAVVFASLARLHKARPRLVASLRASLGQRASRGFQHPKLKLWKMLSTPDQVSANELGGLLAAIEQTEAWHQACRTSDSHRSALNQQRWNYQARLSNAHELIKNLEAAFLTKDNVKLFFWHHFDAMGFVPKSWQNVLAELVRQNWVVVVSSSGMQKKAEETLRSHGCLISQRQNIGLCLGAYRDFCCLINDCRGLRSRIQTLILCNDSMLPLGGPRPICAQTEAIHQQLKTSKSRLMGLTDSVQTKAYHIQSYFLALNKPLFNSPIWIDFWNRFDPRGDKNDLIQRGEVGLSQWLLRHELTLDAKYSLASILIKSHAVDQALQQLDLRQPEQINTTLMCWNALLKAGCPVIKKQLLLEPPDFLPQTVPMAEFRTHLTDADQELVEDLAHLFKSRFLRP